MRVALALIAILAAAGCLETLGVTPEEEYRYKALVIQEVVMSTIDVNRFGGGASALAWYNSTVVAAARINASRLETSKLDGSLYPSAHPFLFEGINATEQHIAYYRSCVRSNANLTSTDVRWNEWCPNPPFRVIQVRQIFEQFWLLVPAT